MAHLVTDQNFSELVLNSKIPVLVDFFAEWCGPCKMIAPIVDELATEYDGKVLIAKLNVDESMDTAQNYGVMSIPTLIFIKNGEEVDRVTGALPKDSLKEKLDGLL
ncbi:thioredoxin [Candidatus Peregrinibacteria bacterium]|nr:MAG: thioredoxin [Candidatus Peregrinibacteria bacterium]